MASTSAASRCRTTSKIKGPIGRFENSNQILHPRLDENYHSHYDGYLCPLRPCLFDVLLHATTRPFMQEHYLPHLLRDSNPSNCPLGLGPFLLQHLRRWHSAHSNPTHQIHILESYPLHPLLVVCSPIRDGQYLHRNRRDDHAACRRLQKLSLRITCTALAGEKFATHGCCY